MLEANKDWVFVAPGINWLVATLYEAEAFGFPQEAAEAVGYKKELEMAIAGPARDAPPRHPGPARRRLRVRLDPARHLRPRPAALRRAARLHPHGSHHLRHRAGAGRSCCAPTSSGKVQPGYLADLLLVDGDPLADITILQDHDKLHYIMKDGRFHKESAADEAPAPDPGNMPARRHRAARDPASLTP